MPEDPVSVLVVGDVFIDIDNGAQAFRHVKGLLSRADLVIGNNEGVYSDDPGTSPTARHAMIAPVARADCLGAVPFHMMSCANNHFVDGGYAGLRDTLDALHHQDILTAGAGTNSAEAFKPAIAERKGLRIALVATASVYPVGYEARSDRPGIAGLRINTHYSVPDPTFWEPGLAGTISTQVNSEDFEKLDRAIVLAKQSADIVLVTCHWGISNTYRTIEGYEVDIAAKIIDLGADGVFCSHHHSLRGVRFWKDKPIFQGLGTFIHHMSHHPSAAKTKALQEKFGEYAHGTRDGFPLFPFHPLARKSGLASLEFGVNGETRVGFYPAVIEPDGATRLFAPDEAGAMDVLDYLREVTVNSGFSTKLELEARNTFAYISVVDQYIDE